MKIPVGETELSLVWFILQVPPLLAAAEAGMGSRDGVVSPPRPPDLPSQ